MILKLIIMIALPKLLKAIKNPPRISLNLSRLYIRITQRTSIKDSMQFPTTMIEDEAMVKALKNIS